MKKDILVTTARNVLERIEERIDVTKPNEAWNEQWGGCARFASGECEGSLEKMKRSRGRKGCGNCAATAEDVSRLRARYERKGYRAVPFEQGDNFPPNRQIGFKEKGTGGRVVVFSLGETSEIWVGGDTDLGIERMGRLVTQERGYVYPFKIWNKVRRG